MGLFKRLGKKQSYSTKKGLSLTTNKSWAGFAPGIAYPALLSMTNFLNGSSTHAALLFQYYNTVSALATAIDKITGPLIDIPIKVQNDEGEVVENSQELDFLKKPNCFQTYRSFMKELSTNLLVAGNTFIKLTGDINKAPLEMINVSPCNIEIEMDSDGGVYKYTEKTSSKGGQTVAVYTRLVPTQNNCHRYVTKDKKHELIHIKDLVNCYDSMTREYGVSKMTALLIEIEQLVKANIFNYSELVRGAELSMVVIFKEEMLQEDFDHAKAQINNEWGGAERAGNVAVLRGGDVEIKDLSKSIKDMDYKNLKDEINRAIYTRYQIPLALVSEKTMTFNNLATANFLLYDEAIIPLLNIILESLNLYVMPRFKDTNYVYCINKREISALETRQNERVKILADIGVLTQNELRKELGFNTIEGGDVLPLSAFKALKHLDKEDIVNNDLDLNNLYGN